MSTVKKLVAFSKENADKLDSLAAHFQRPVTRVINTLLTLPEDELRQMLDGRMLSRKDELERKRKLMTALRKRIADKSPDEIEQLMNSLDEQNDK